MKLTEGVLASHRCVQVEYNADDDTITVEVVEGQISARSRTIPVRTPVFWGLFGRPLVERIRQAVIECDNEITVALLPPVDPKQALVDAAYSALYHSPPMQSFRGKAYTPPPLVVLRSRQPERGESEGMRRRKS